MVKHSWKESSAFVCQQKWLTLFSNWVKSQTYLQEWKYKIKDNEQKSFTDDDLENSSTDDDDDDDNDDDENTDLFIMGL